MDSSVFTELHIREGTADIDSEIHRVFRLFRTNPEKRSAILLDISHLLTDSCAKENAEEILKLLVEDGIYDVLSKSFESETDETILKAACVVSAVLYEMISFEKAGSEFRRIRFVEHLTTILSSGNRSVRTAAMNALREMIRKEKRMGEMIGEMIGVTNMVKKVKEFVEGEKGGKRMIEIEEMCGVIGVIGEMIACGVKVGEDDEMIELVSWIEEEGMKKEDEEGEEGNVWRRLGNEVLILERTLMKKKGRTITLGRAMEEAECKEKENKTAMKEIERLKKEQEDLRRREEEWKNKAEVWKKEVEKLKKGNNKDQKENTEVKDEIEEVQTSKGTGRSVNEQTMGTLQSVKVEFADEAKMKRDINLIIHHGDSRYCSCLIGDEMKTSLLGCGVVDSSLGSPQAGDDLSDSNKGTLYNQKDKMVQHIFSKPTEGSTITMEVDLRSDEPAKRTIHWYHNGKDIGGFFFNLPPSVRFGVALFRRNDSIELISLEKCIFLLKGGLVEGKGWRFEGGDEPQRL